MVFQRAWLVVLSLVVASLAINPLFVLATTMNNKPDSSKAYLMDDTIPPPHLQTHPMLQVPCAVQLVTDDEDAKLFPVQTFVDTGAQVSVLSADAAAQAGVLHMMDRRYAGHALGVGKCRVLGRLPAGILKFHLHGNVVDAPAVTVLEYTNDGVDLLLGLDFLRDYGAILNLQTEEMILSTKTQGIFSIPFIRPRAVLNFGAEDSDAPYDYNNCYDQRLCNDYTDTDEEGLDMSGL